MFGQIDQNLMAWFLWGMDPKKRSKYQARLSNDRVFVNQLQLLTNLALNTFEWTGLPDGTSGKFIEEAMLYSGNCALAMDEDLGFITLPFTNSDKVNIYGEPVQIKLSGKAGYSKYFVAATSLTDAETAKLTKVEAVPGYDNQQKYAYFMYILDYAGKISSVLRSLDVSVKKIKNPHIIIADKGDEQAYRKYINDLETNENAIMLSRSINTENALTTTDITIDTAVVDTLWQQYQRYFADIMQILGIENNPQVDKIAGVSDEEVNSNNMSTNEMLDIRLKERTIFANKCNEIFGTSISVKIRHQKMLEDFDLLPDDESDDKDTQTDNEKEGDK